MAFPRGSIGVLLLLVFAAAVAAAAAPQLLGVVNRRIGQSKRVVCETVLVDPLTGSLQTLTENFINVGDSLQVSAISALDQKSGTLYYATDGSDEYVYSVDTQKKLILPPVNLQVQETSGLRFDSSSQVLYAFVTDASKSPAVIAYGVPTGPVTSFSLPNGTNLGAAVAIDEAQRLLYIANAVDIGAASVASELLVVTLGAAVPPIATVKLACKTLIQSLWLDGSALYGISYAPASGDFYIVQLDAKTGACAHTSLLADQNILASAFDSVQRVLYYVDGTQIRTLNMATSASTVASTDLILVDLEVWSSPAQALVL